MLVKPSAELVRSLHFVKKQAAWGAVEAAFDRELTETYRQLAQARDDVDVRQLQGRAKMISEFMKLVADTDELLKRF